MAERRPLVVIGGITQELPAGDTLPGSGGGGGGSGYVYTPKSDMWLSPALTGFLGNQILSAGVQYMVPVLVGEDGDVDGLVSQITVTGDASSVLALGLYTADATRGDFTRVDSGGTIAADSTGVKVASITAVAVTQGVYWIYMAHDSSGNVSVARGQNDGAMVVGPDSTSTNWTTGADDAKHYQKFGAGYSLPPATLTGFLAIDAIYSPVAGLRKA